MSQLCDHFNNANNIFCLNLNIDLELNFDTTGFSKMTHLLFKNENIPILKCYRAHFEDKDFLLKPWNILQF